MPPYASSLCFQVDELLALCAHARQDVAARYPSASVPFFIAGGWQRRNDINKGERCQEGCTCCWGIAGSAQRRSLPRRICSPDELSLRVLSLPPLPPPGHSLGGLIAALACLRDQGVWSGLLLCSAALDVEMGLVLK